MKTRPAAAFLLSGFCAGAAQATVLSGVGGQGVPAGQSSLIGAYDYSDAFTGVADGGTNSARIYAPAVQGAPAYAVQNTYGHPATNFQSQTQLPGIAEFSFTNNGPPGLVDGFPAFPGNSGAGSATGFTQTGNSLDYGVAYGFRTRYTVQFDAVNVSDRIDITTGGIPGSIGFGNLSVFIRGNGTGGMSVYNGVDTPVPGVNTGLLNDGKWHNFAATFDTVAKTIDVYIDETLRASVNLNTFAGGIYATSLTNGFVGVGAGLGGGQNRTWTDNFQVGAPIPEPSGALLLTGFAALGALRRRRVS